MPIRKRPPPPDSLPAQPPDPVRAGRHPGCTVTFFAFDLETTELAADRAGGVVPPISCAGIALADGSVEGLFLPAAEPACYDGAGAMSQVGAVRVVRRLEELVAAGSSLVTWNGAGFDLPVLARASGLHDECVGLALGGVDMMFQVLATKGWPIKLAVALEGMGLPAKTGDGLEAVTLWREGHHEQVLHYCTADAARTLQLALAAQGRALRWTSSKGMPQTMSLAGGWLTVAQCLKLPEPDTSWMDQPLRREDLLAWCTSG